MYTYIVSPEHQTQVTKLSLDTFTNYFHESVGKAIRCVVHQTQRLSLRCQHENEKWTMIAMQVKG